MGQIYSRTGDVHKAYEYNGLKVGAWQSRQRQTKRKGMLSQERIALMNNAKGWQWGVHRKRRANTVVEPPAKRIKPDP